MSKTVTFARFPGSVLDYYCDGEFFYINCSLKSPPSSPTKLYLCSSESKNEKTERFFVGTLDNDTTSLAKSYPISFVREKGFNPGDVLSFSLVDSEGATHYCKEFNNVDPAIIGAQSVLDSLKSSRSWGIKPLQCYNRICDAIKDMPEVSLPVFPSFRWHRACDIRLTFSLTSFEHILFDSGFVRAFSHSGFWYIALTGQDRLIAICVKCPPEFANPMTNVSDCMINKKVDGMSYYCVGIGLYDDGQYFCSLKN